MKLHVLPVESSLGKKYLMALTGLGLVLFVLAHMVGNLLIFVGRDSINSYSQGLHNLGGLLWVARGGLLVIFVLHLAYGLRVTFENRKARPDRYVYERTVHADWASRHMLLTGVLLFAFVLYHLAHFTFHIVHAPLVRESASVVVPYNYGALEQRGWKIGEPPRHDVYAMVVFGFRNPWIALSYLFFQAVLWLHLWHGGSSWFQSLGLNHPRYNRLIRWTGPVLATLVLVGNCSIPLACWTGLLPIPLEYLAAGAP
jgi:succinate dehydrogenase / fumarate reductase cytochrome b subunit